MTFMKRFPRLTFNQRGDKTQMLLGSNLGLRTWKVIEVRLNSCHVLKASSSNFKVKWNKNWTSPIKIKLQLSSLAPMSEFSNSPLENEQAYPNLPHGTPQTQRPLIFISPPKYTDLHADKTCLEERLKHPN